MKSRDVEEDHGPRVPRPSGLKEGVVRFGVSLEPELLEALDAYQKRRGQANRSQALRSLLREYLVEERLQEGSDVVGTLSLIYNHHQRELVNKLVAIQHDHHDIILSSQHIHIDHRHCLEVILLRGAAREAQALRDKLSAQKGIIHATLSAQALIS